MFIRFVRKNYLKKKSERSGKELTFWKRIDTRRIKEDLQGALSCLDVSYIYSLFLVADDKSILHQDNIQKGK